METREKQEGNAPLKTGKRNKRIDVYFSDEEFCLLNQIIKATGWGRQEIVRKRVLENSTSWLIDMKDMLTRLDGIGADLGRAGDDINQLAAYVSVLKRQGKLTPEFVVNFHRLFEAYILIQTKLEKAMRQLLKAMK